MLPYFFYSTISRDRNLLGPFYSQGKEGKRSSEMLDNLIKYLLKKQ